MPGNKLNARTDIYVWGRMTWLVDGAITSNPDMSLARMEVDVGKKSEAHRHSNSHECIHVISGQITEVVDGSLIELNAGESVFIPKGATHFTVNIGCETAVLIVSYSEQSREYEAIISE